MCIVGNGTRPDQSPHRVMRESIATGIRKREHVEADIAVCSLLSYPSACKLATALSSVSGAQVTDGAATYRDNFLCACRLLRRPS